MATFAQVMEVLYAVYGPGSDEWKSRFKSRVHNFQKMGIPIGLSPGKGQKIDYTREHIYQMVFCIECADMGLTPAKTYALVEKAWDKIYAWTVLKIMNGKITKDKKQIGNIGIGYIGHEIIERNSPIFLLHGNENNILNSQFLAVKRGEQDRRRWRHVAIINMANIIDDLEPHIIELGMLPPIKGKEP